MNVKLMYDINDYIRYVWRV